VPRALPVLAVLALLPAVHAAPVPKSAEAYFPTKVGARWVYDGGDGKEEVKTVTKTEATADGVMVTVAGEGPGGRAGDTSTVRVARDGVFVHAERGETFDPPACLLKLPAGAGDAWDFLGGKEKLRMTVAGVEAVEVPAGKYTAVRVDMTGTAGGTTVKATGWYAPGVGLVKATQGGKTVTVLKSFTPGRD